MKKFNMSIFAAGCLIFAAFFLSDCRPKKAANEVFAPFEEQVRNRKFALCEVTQFAELTQQEKLLAYYLSQGVIAGDPIVYRQIHPDGYQIKLFLDGVAAHSVGMDDRLKTEMEEYAKLYWANHGIYDCITGLKYLPLPVRNKFEYSVVIALSNGARVGFTSHSRLDSLFNILEPVIFDSTFESKIYGPRQRKWNEKYSGICCAGNDTLKAGVFSGELANIVDNLNSSRQYADNETAETLRLLGEYFTTGDEKYYNDYLNRWIRQGGKIDWALGFFPADSGTTYSRKIYQGMVFLQDSLAQDVISKIRESYKDFLGFAPLDFNSAPLDFSGCYASAGELLASAGDWGYNIPEALHFEYTQDSSVFSKSIILTNVLKTKAVCSGRDGKTIAVERAFLLLKEAVGRPFAKMLLSAMSVSDANRLLSEEMLADMTALRALTAPACSDLGLMQEPVDESAILDWFQSDFLYGRISHSAGYMNSAEFRAKRIIFNLSLNDTSSLNFEDALDNIIAGMCGKNCDTALYGFLKYDSDIHPEYYAKFADESAMKLPPGVEIITPMIKISVNKMGKVEGVVLEYPQSVIEYGVYIAENSRVLENIK